jgi:hypothetical protein
MRKPRSQPRPQTVRDLARDRPMVAGSLVEQYVTCGKPTCRCARGAKHGPLYYLYWKEQGRSRSLYVPRDRVTELRSHIANYRRFQVELGAVVRRQLRAWQRCLQKGRPQ